MDLSLPDSGGCYGPMDAKEVRDLVSFTPSRRFMFLDADTGAVAYFGCEHEGAVAISRGDGSIVGCFSSTASAFRLMTLAHDLFWVWLDPDPVGEHA